MGDIKHDVAIILRHAKSTPEYLAELVPALDRIVSKLAASEARAERLDGACVAAYRALTGGSWFVRDEAVELLKAAIAAAKEGK